MMKRLVGRLISLSLSNALSSDNILLLHHLGLANGDIGKSISNRVNRVLSPMAHKLLLKDNHNQLGGGDTHL